LIFIAASGNRRQLRQPAQQEKRDREADRVGVHPQLVRVDGAARHQQRVVVIGGHVGDHAVDRKASGRLHVELPGLNLAGMQRDDLGRGSRTV